MKKSNLKLELYKLGELPESWSLDENNPDLAGELEELNESDREILEKYSPSQMAAQISRRLEGGKKEVQTDNIIPFSRKLTTRFLIPAAAALLAIGLILPLTLKNTGNTGLELTRIKGAEDPQLRVYRKTGNESEMMKNNSDAVQHDLLQLTYQVSGPSFGVILSVDGRGVVTKHYPESEDKAPRLTTGGEQFLPFSYELDDAPNFETFYLVTSDKPFSTEKIMDITASAAATGDYVLDIPALIGKSQTLSGKFKQFAVPIRKEDGHE